MVVININLSVPPEKQEEGKGVPIHAEINMLKREDANDNEWKFARALEEVLKITLMGMASEITRWSEIK